MCRHSIEWEATLLTMYHELGEEWVPNPRNKLFEKEESLLKKMTEVRDIHIRDAMIHNLGVLIYCRFCITIQPYIVRYSKV